jgi:hypothetical protein
MEYPTPDLARTPSADTEGVHNAYACSSSFKSMASKLDYLGKIAKYGEMLSLIQNCEKERRAATDALPPEVRDRQHEEALQLIGNLKTSVQSVLEHASRYHHVTVIFYPNPWTFRLTLFESATKPIMKWRITPSATVWLDGGKLSKKSKSKKTRRSKKSRKTRKSNRI